MRGTRVRTVPVGASTHPSGQRPAFSFATALLLPGLAPSLPLFIAASLVAGACNGTMDIAMNTNATVVEKAWGSAIMSSFHAFFSLGGLVGAALSGLLISLDIGALVEFHRKHKKRATLTAIQPPGRSGARQITRAVRCVDSWLPGLSPVAMEFSSNPRFPNRRCQLSLPGSFRVAPSACG